MNATQKKAQRKTTTKQGGSNLTKQVSDLAVPFGLILAKQSLQNFLNSDAAKSTSKKASLKSAKTTKRVSLNGGTGCGKVKVSAGAVEGYDAAKPLAASRGGGRKTTSTKGGSGKSTPPSSARTRKVNVSK